MNRYVVLTAIIAIFLSTFFFVNPISAAEVIGKSLNIVIEQGKMNEPRVLSVTIQNNNPERYMVVYPDGFLTIKELDASGNVLYEGQINRYRYELPEMTNLVADNPLFINFPYFDESQKVTIFDENGKQLIDIDLNQYSILATPTPAPRTVECNSCGYCAGKKPPGTLDACMKCLYPNLTIQQTLAANPPNYHPPKTKTGAFFSQLGCIDVGIAGFTDTTASGGVLNTILNRFLFPITGVLALVSLIYGAFLMMTAQGNAEQIARGRRWVYGAVIGVVFTYGSILIIRIIGSDILRIPGFGK